MDGARWQKKHKEQPHRSSYRNAPRSSQRNPPTQTPDAAYAEGLISRFTEEHCILGESKFLTLDDFHGRLLVTNESKDVLGMRRVGVFVTSTSGGRNLCATRTAAEAMWAFP